MTTEFEHYKQAVEHLERELDEMTAALTQAWDQLVPFLQEIPAQPEMSQNIIPILEAVALALDSEQAGLYLFESGTWFSIPDVLHFTDAFMAQMVSITHEQTINLRTTAGRDEHWAFAPIVSEKRIVGVLGTGIHYDERHFTAVELRILTRMAERIGGQIAVAQLAQFREREAVQAREMQIANQIQQSVQPTESPQSQRIRLASYWQPAKEVGGDAWGWVQHDEDRLTWFVLDVAGKGLPAALAAVSLHTAISIALHLRLSPVHTLRVVNEELYSAYTRTDLIATVAVVSFNAAEGMLEIANAGHPPVLVRQGGEWQRLAATAPPIGVLPDLHAETQRLKIRPNDLILCYSDGFTEIQMPSARLWGQTGLLNAVSPGANDVQAVIRQIVAASQQAGTVQDDQTLVAALYTNG
jgi:serine phosphatase RsbU (regulator of sigma subunit)